MYVYGVSSTSEVQTKLKEWVRTKDEGLSMDEALQLSTVIHKALAEKGIPLDRGCRIQRVQEKASEVKTTSEDMESDESSNREPTPTKVSSIRTKSTIPRKTRTTPLKCYACGSRNHLIGNCPNKHCYNCGEAGHKPFKCPRKLRRPWDQKRRIYEITTGKNP
ncbi:hypothetical protein LOD99_10778 [Oopsacas minuta]|uniref:CCHC-type domain-containing protein n=1 Tax=Oopsacas minuta TaxID=111878 RepID=A0AAV7KEW6_9METZ|nr:hypothetical protein LOD99_10778 [Oopsacas minuta]